MQTFKNECLKWLQTFKICISKHTSYRVSFFLQILGPSLAFFFMKYHLWRAIFDSNQQSSIGSNLINGLNFEQMIQYHFWVLIVTLLAQGHVGTDLALDIRMGKISTYLIYPFSFFRFHFISFLAFQSIQLIVTGLTFSIGIGMNLLGNVQAENLIIGFLFCFLISIFWFVIQFSIGVLGFWLEETWILRVTLGAAVTFLSGAIMPIDFFPPWLVEVLSFTPFPYLTYLPAKIFSGDLSLIRTGFFTLIFWVIAVGALNNFLWRKGLNEYTAAGI